MSLVDSAIELQKRAINRPPAWRWLKAQLIRESPSVAQFYSRDDDTWVSRLVVYQREFNECTSPEDLGRLYQRWPNIHTAHLLYISEEIASRLTRYELEARFLTREPLTRILRRVFVTEQVAIWYEKAFFNVLDRIQYKSYINHAVIGEKLHYSLTERDIDTLWKIFAYTGNAFVLDVVVDKTIRDVLPAGHGQVNQFMQGKVRSQFGIKAVTAAHTIPVNSYTAQAILEIHTKQDEIRRLMQNGSDTDMLTANVKEMIDSLTWRVGESDEVFLGSDRNIVSKVSDRILATESGDTDFGTSDLLRLASGEKTSRIEEMEAAVFPGAVHANSGK